MPFQIVKTGINKFRLYNKEKKRYTKNTYSTRQNAKKAGDYFERYDKANSKKNS